MINFFFKFHLRPYFLTSYNRKHIDVLGTRSTGHHLPGKSTVLLDMKWLGSSSETTNDSRLCIGLNLGPSRLS